MLQINKQNVICIINLLLAVVVVYPANAQINAQKDQFMYIFDTVNKTIDPVLKTPDGKYLKVGIAQHLGERFGIPRSQIPATNKVEDTNCYQDVCHGQYFKTNNGKLYFALAVFTDGTIHALEVKVGGQRFWDNDHYSLIRFENVLVSSVDKHTCSLLYNVFHREGKSITDEDIGYIQSNGRSSNVQTITVYGCLTNGQLVVTEVEQVVGCINWSCPSARRQTLLIENIDSSWRNFADYKQINGKYEYLPGYSARKNQLNNTVPILEKTGVSQ